MKQYKKFFEFDGVELEFTDEAMRAIAEQAIQRGTGARGLRAIMEEVLLNVMYELPSREDVTKCLVDRDVVLIGREPDARAARAAEEAARRAPAAHRLMRRARRRDRLLHRCSPCSRARRTARTSGGASTGGDLTGVTWVLDQASMMTLVDSAERRARSTSRSTGRRRTGGAACNTYGGGYEADARPAR